MAFSDNLKKIGAIWNGEIPEINDIVDDTREIHPGNLFVLRQGANPLTATQIADYLEKAASAGAAAVIADPDCVKHAPLPLIHLSEPHKKLGDIARAYYGNPSQDLKIVAVTGTNGKTTTTYLIESLAQSYGLKVGVLGTISYRYPGFEEPAPNTTPGTLRLYRLLSRMKAADCDLVAMEVSSHGIVQGRIEGMTFDVAIWNNLGTDHLDFHKTREEYALAKQRLFDHYLVTSYQNGKKPVAVANLDDSEVMQHIQQANPSNWGNRVITYAIKQNRQKADVQIVTPVWRNGAYACQLQSPDGQTHLMRMPLIGEYNLSNAAAAMCALYALGYDFERLSQAMSQIAQIPGRMEIVHNSPVVIVDFAHTPEAMEKALDAARGCMNPEGKLWAVFGAGGDRDPSKRPMMGRVAAQKADSIVVTSDNPRTENPEKIINDIFAGIPADRQAFRYPDRKEAITYALSQAAANDLIIIIGKGHEDYQILGMQKIHFDDREVVRNYYI